MIRGTSVASWAVAMGLILLSAKWRMLHLNGKPKRKHCLTLGFSLGPRLIQRYEFPHRLSLEGCYGGTQDENFRPQSLEARLLSWCHSIAVTVDTNKVSFESLALDCGATLAPVEA